MYQVGAEAVLQIPIVAGVEKYQIGGLAGFQRSHLFRTVQRVSAVDGSRGNGLLDGHSQPPAGQRHHRLHIEPGSMVRIKIAAQRDRHTDIDQRAGGSFPGIAAEGSAGQERDHDTRFDELPGLAYRNILQMIDAGHMVPRGQRNGAFGVRTVGVNLAGEPELPRRLQVAIETG